MLFTIFKQCVSDNVGDKLYSCSLLSLICLLHIVFETNFTVVHYFLNQCIVDNVGDKFYYCFLVSLIILLQIILATSFTVVHYFL